VGFSALAGLAVGGPAVPFVGVSVLGYLFGSASAIPIAVAALVMNVIQVPVTLVLLSLAAVPGRAGPGSSRPPAGLGGHVVAAVKEPVVWAPLGALVLILAGVTVSPVIDDSLKLLGSATGGVALFASGIVLYAQRVTLSRDVIAIVASRNVVVPGDLRGLGVAVTAKDGIEVVQVILRGVARQFALE
jgi:hypothetical protein